MSADRVFSGKPGGVTIGLLDGRKLTGTIARFSPATADLALTLPSAQSGFSGGRTTLAAERIAFVAFHREGAEPNKGGDAELKIHVAGGGTFLVDMVWIDVPIAVGFYARPREASSPFGEFFFYHHGVNAKEINQPLGAMLVKDGRLKEGDVRRGLAAQHQARVPIGQILVEHKKVNAAAIEEAAALQSRKRLRIGEILIEAGLAEAADIEFALAEQKRR